MDSLFKVCCINLMFVANKESLVIDYKMLASVDITHDINVVLYIDVCS